MGKPYASELQALTSTYAWSLTADVGDFARWLRSSAGQPLLAVGSGGSLTSAHFAAFLHTRFTGHLAKAGTPLELVHTPAYLPELALLLLSAGGGNPDILAGVTHALQRQPARFGVLCGRTGSPLGELVRGVSDVFLQEFDSPAGKDGFLATNSLLATAVILARAYALAFDTEPGLPETLPMLLHPESTEEAYLAQMAERCRPLWDRDTLVVLHGAATMSAAVDLESKFTEAAVGHVQLADYRNFAHGRHHWLARHGSETAVLALAAPEDSVMAEKTLRLLPNEIPAVRLDFALAGVPSALAALVAAIRLVGLAGPLRGVDPGRPSVPTFGRRLYHLEGLRTTSIVPDLKEEERAAIERKAGATLVTLAARDQLQGWRQTYGRYREALRLASFAAVVFDYDGTLCGADERFNGPREEVARHLDRLLRAGIWIGIATGRGKSVRKDLQRILPDKSLWARVVIAYHNGGEVGLLADDTIPPVDEHLDESLRPLLEQIRNYPGIPQSVKCEARLKQVTVELPEGTGESVWEAVANLVRVRGSAGVFALRSSHSIDILAPGVSKRVLVERLRDVACADGEKAVLCFGDKGRWPGNDFELLAEPFSLSVDEVSADPTTCWNLAPPGTRCIEACLAYFERMLVADGRVRLDL